MNEHQQNFRTGVFVTGSLILLLAMLFYLGLSEIFVEKIKVFTYFPESVQGLSVGSSVKYRGVPMGTVSQLSIDMTSRKVFVVMELEPRYFHNKPDQKLQTGIFLKTLQDEIDRGLRCRLEFAGITGMKFIDFDYFAAEQKTDDLLQNEMFSGEPSALYIPSVPSTMKDLSGALSSSLERLSNIRFEEIAGELERSLAKLSDILSDPAIRSAINRINDAAENLEVSTSTVARVFDEKRLNRILDSLENDLEVFRHLGEQLSASAKDMKLPESAAVFRNAVEQLMESREDIVHTLSKFNQTLESIRMMTDYLSTDPEALIKGKKNQSKKK